MQTNGGRVVVVVVVNAVGFGQFGSFEPGIQR